MVRSELHSVRRPFFDCTSYRRPLTDRALPTVDRSLHLHADMVQPLPRQTMRYRDITVALRLAA